MHLSGKLKIDKMKFTSLVYDPSLSRDSKKGHRKCQEFLSQICSI